MLSGMVAALDRLVNANDSAGQTLRKKRSGLMPLSVSSTACTPNMMARPR